MTPLDQRRRERAANGSRRKRDVAAAQSTRPYDPVAYAAEHFPTQRFGAVQAAAYHVSARHQHHCFPDPAEVRERMIEKGWLVSDGGEA